MAATDGTMFPSLFYRDATAAIDFLERAFGFRRTLVVPGEDGGIAHAELMLGRGMIMLGTARESDGHRTADALPARHAGVYVTIEDVRGHYERAVANGARIGRPFAERDFGGAAYSAFDPEGHEWHFGSYVPEAAREAAEART